MGVNDATEAITRKVDGKRVWMCPIYKKWQSMFMRCYNQATHKNQPTYSECYVHESWHRFSTFKKWMLSQEWEGKHLDKDLLVIGNRVYSEDTCVFVNRLTNLFIVDRCKARGKYKIGTSRIGDKFQSHCRDPFKRYKEYLGCFKTEQEAHEVWLAKKLEYAYEVAMLENDVRVKEAIINKYLNYNKKAHTN